MKEKFTDRLKAALQNAYDVGYEHGHKDGESVAHSVGYTTGYEEAIDDANSVLAETDFFPSYTAQNKSVGVGTYRQKNGKQPRPTKLQKTNEKPPLAKHLQRALDWLRDHDGATQHQYNKDVKGNRAALYLLAQQGLVRRDGARFYAGS
jgi:hypothetical protein